MLVSLAKQFYKRRLYSATWFVLCLALPVDIGISVHGKPKANRDLRSLFEYNA